jgi:hemolysin III
MDWLDFHDPVSAWTHAAWLILAIPATLVLRYKARGDETKRLGFWIFGLGMVLCYGGSTLWHAFRLHVFAILDYIGIFVLIAGTTTPIVLVVLRGVWRWGTLAYIWATALSGIAACMFLNEMPKAAITGIYLGMGWGMCICYFELSRVLSHRKMRLILLGGLLYSVGAVLNLLRWPTLIPGVFGSHEIFHVFVMAGTLTHFWFMLKVLVPFDRATALGTETANIKRIIEEGVPVPSCLTKRAVGEGVGG